MVVQEQDLPIPLAHFPLTGGSLASVLLPPYNGTTLSNEGDPAWVEDLKFGSVVHCNNVSTHSSSSHAGSREAFALTCFGATSKRAAVCAQ